MRRDIKKVICEDGRRGDKSYSGGQKDFDGYFKYSRESDDRFEEFADLDCLPKQESMTKRLGWEMRSFSENLGALRGLVTKNVGKNWDKIYSDLCKIVSPTGSQVERHVHQHLGDFIEIDTRINSAGEIEVQKYSGSWEPLSYAWVDYYVHPKTRCICRIKHKKKDRYGFGSYAERKKAEAHARRRDTKNPLVQFHKFNGCWWRVDLEEYDVKDEFITDLIVKNPVAVHEPSRYRPTRTIEPSKDMLDMYGRTGVRCVFKKQLNKSELKKAGLTNV
jgi:hypothetical protein